MLRCSFLQTAAFRAAILPVFILAGLITYGTACLAGRLAGCLALAASALYGRFLIIPCIKCFYMLHI